MIHIKFLGMWDNIIFRDSKKALEEILQDESDEWFYIAKHALEKIKQKEEKNETSENQSA